MIHKDSIVPDGIIVSSYAYRPTMGERDEGGIHWFAQPLPNCSVSIGLEAALMLQPALRQERIGLREQRRIPGQQHERDDQAGSGRDLAPQFNGAVADLSGTPFLRRDDRLWTIGIGGGCN